MVDGRSPATGAFPLALVLTTFLRFGELCVLVTLLFIRLVPVGVGFGGARVVLVARCALCFPAALESTGRGEEVVGGGGPKRRETCALSSLRDLIGDFSPAAWFGSSLVVATLEVEALISSGGVW